MSLTRAPFPLFLLEYITVAPTHAKATKGEQPDIYLRLALSSRQMLLFPRRSTQVLHASFIAV